MLLGAGVGMCLLAYPAGVLANGTTVSKPLAAAAQSTCPSSLPSTFPDPVFPAAAKNSYFNDAEAATTDANLPSGFVGPGTGATTGTPTSPVPAAAFGIGFFDETELHEDTASSFPHTELAGVWPGTTGNVGATGTLATDTGTLTHTTAGATAFGSATSAYGVGQPYAAILTPDLKTILVAKVPTQVLFEGYTPNPTGGHVQYTGVMSHCGNGPLYAILGFDVTKYNLDPTKTYAAYILMSDTDMSGPLANHLWYFTPAPSTPQVGTLTGHILQCVSGAQTSTEVPGGSISTTINGSSASQNNPASFANLTPGLYPASASAPSGFMFVHCPSSDTTYTITNNGASASYVSSLNVPANGSANANFYVVPITGQLNGHIYLCDNGTQTTQEVTGGTITFQGQSALPNPVSLNVAPGSYGASATAPANFTFVQCSSNNYTINNGTATYTNPVQVTSTTPGTAIFYVTGPPLQVTKSVTPTGSVPINTDLTYTVTVKNTGTVDETTGTLSDVLSVTGGATCSIKTPASVDKGTVSANSGSACPNSWSWDLSSVTFHPGDTATLTVVITALSPGTLTNVAVLPGSNCTGSTSAPCGTTTPVTLLLTKTEDGVSGPITVKLGDTISYQVIVTNNSDNPAQNVTVDDAMGGTAAFQVNDGTNGTTNSFTSNDKSVKVTGSNGNYTWTFATIAAGATGEVDFTAVILSPGTTASTINGTVSLTNTATVTELPPVTVVANAPLSGVQAATTPPTGAFPEINVSVAGFMFLGGLGFILLGLLARRPRFGDLSAS